MSCARSFWFAIISSNQRRMITARCLAVCAAQAGNAAAAASIARRVAAPSSCGTVPSVTPVAGLWTGVLRPSAASSHWPLT